MFSLFEGLAVPNIDQSAEGEVAPTAVPTPAATTVPATNGDKVEDAPPAIVSNVLPVA